MVTFDLQLLEVKFHVKHRASARENLSSGLANNKGAEQSALPRRLISAFVIRFLEIIIFKLASCKISIF